MLNTNLLEYKQKMQAKIKLVIKLKLKIILLFKLANTKIISLRLILLWH